MTEQIKKEMSAVTDNNAAAVTDDEMALINAYSRRTLTKDEVYVFGVVLCDNDIDRDNERFTVESLFELEKLFVGKTGIFDHSPTAKNQTARIFACSVESVDGRKTANGDDYFRLTARAYIPKTKGNEEIIQAIDSGILKEVSIGCAAGEVRCGICGENINHCAHIKGETYGGKLTENLTQAVGRDCLAFALDNLRREGYEVVFHVHDEVVIEVPKYGSPEGDLQQVVRIMSKVPPWAKGLPLNAAGWYGDFFTKD